MSSQASVSSSQHSLPPPPPPPKLQFDEGIRYTSVNSNVQRNNNDENQLSNSSENNVPLLENPRLKPSTATNTITNANANNNTNTKTNTTNEVKVTSIYDYYEIERLVNEIHHIATTTVFPLSASIDNTVSNTVRIAIQLPDELLMDAMDLCQEYELALLSLEENHHHSDDSNNHHNIVPINYQVYVLGDTTYAPCCPDRMAAQHISAHILIHYGHACFSHIRTSNHHENENDITSGENDSNPNTTTPTQLQQQQQQPEYPIVLYSFGKQMISISQCVRDVLQALHIQYSQHHHHQQPIPSHSSKTTTNLPSQPVLSIPNDNTTKTKTTTTTTRSISQNILLLYEVQYTHAMKELRTALSLHQQVPPSTTTTNSSISSAASNPTDRCETSHNHPNNEYNDNIDSFLPTKFELHIKIGRIPQWKDNGTASSPPSRRRPHDTIDIVATPTTSTTTTTTTSAPIVPVAGCCGDTTTASSSSLSSMSCGRCNRSSALTKSIHPNDDQVVAAAMTPSSIPPLETAANATNASDCTAITHSTRTISKIKEQYHQIMVGGLELPYPFSSSSSSSKFSNDDDDNDDSEWVYDSDCGTESSSNTDNENSYIILYIGDVTSRPFLNIVLRFLSSSNVTCIDRKNTSMPGLQQYHLSSIWAWTPKNTLVDSTLLNQPSSSGRLCTDVLHSNVFQKILQRRYYLIQKAKQCTTFGIIVAHMTPNIQPLVQSIQHYLDQQQRCSGKNDDNKVSISYYTFVVGKINPTKLANFPEIECFILVACPEHALLQNERELYPIPIITPYELLVAFGSNKNHHQIEWGDTPYSTDPNDYWTLSSAVADLSLTDHASKSDINDYMNDDVNDDDDDDAPYFSLVTGKYETRTKAVAAEATTTTQTMTVMASEQSGSDVTALSTRTDGTIVQFGKNKSTSAAADFLKQREYQGLVMMTPPNEDPQLHDQVERDNMDETNSNYSIIQPAIVGRSGIASNYSNR